MENLPQTNSAHTPPSPWPLWMASHSAADGVFGSGTPPQSDAFNQAATETLLNPDPAVECEIFESAFKDETNEGETPATPNRVPNMGWYTSPDQPPQKLPVMQNEPQGWAEMDERWNRAVQENAARQRNFVAAINSSPPVRLEGVGQVASHPKVIVERTLLERPTDIRTAARNLSEAFRHQTNELRNSKPNEPGQLARYESLISFFEQMAGGLADLADALDRAFSSATASPTSPPEPVFLGKAAEIARGLQLRMQQWLEQTGTAVIDVPVRIGVLCAAIAFLHSLGADSLAAIGALGWLVRRQGDKDKK
jgi:hypothetical protein